MRLVVIAGTIATIVSLIGTPLLIKILARHGYAQAIRVSSEWWRLCRSSVARRLNPN